MKCLLAVAISSSEEELKAKESKHECKSGDLELGWAETQSSTR
jgi:hypothetical protein